ncbi:ribosomal RNA small subunit methyltransferase I [Sporomusaceae bacterium FL31]|nr:ribosomal RNA small subunit methyltransferase I [Sporomusaceae bacterium FL31]GCE34124.1 ribosomal RNA small subunit methyltransferase I [Sporomusaceae bacterium]
MTVQPGSLYLCATPIGNLEDMTFRAIRVLKEAAVVAAEDTRHTRKLLTHFDIHTPLVSYHEHNKTVRGPELIERLLKGESVVVVSDAGMPGISDPGSHLVQLAIEADIPVIPLPGANAALSALVCSGLDTTAFTFVGFLPKTTKKRREFIGSLAKLPTTLLFYESPHRIKDTLDELLTGLGDRQAVAARELTKKFEQFVRGSLSSLQTYFNENLPRGEFTIVIAGNNNAQDADTHAEPALLLPLDQAVQALMQTGVDKKAAIREVALQRDISKREVYQAVIGKE